MKDFLSSLAITLREREEQRELPQLATQQTSMQTGPQSAWGELESDDGVYSPTSPFSDEIPFRTDLMIIETRRST